jgi:CPA2 family monovalent cation:H+ antiporter-2
MTHDLPVLRELALLAGCSLAILLLFHRLRLPPVAGFLVTGVLIGPGGLGLVRDPATVRTVAEIGVVLLLFTVGLEFSLTDIRRLGRRAFIAGVLQILFTVTVVAGALMAFGAHPARALFFGVLLAPSSTALLFKLLTDSAELTTPYGRLTTGVLLLQDLAVVPLAVLTPVLAAWAMTDTGGPTPRFGIEPVVSALAVTVLVILAFLGARRVVPWLLARASGVRSRETFLAGVVMVVLGSAFLSEQAGLSVALGAFLAGLILADSELRSQVAADVLPFRDTFSSVFFISIGMLLVPADALRHPGYVLAATVGMVLWKGAAASLAGRLAGYPWRVALAAGFALAQVGEFSFVLAEVGTEGGLLPEPWGQSFIAGAVFSMLIAPWIFQHASEWGLWIEFRLRSVRSEALLPGAGAEEPPSSPLMADHVVIAGLGLNGRNVARVLRAVSIRHVVLDQSPDLVARCTKEGSHGLIGNVVQPEILRQAGVARARVLVLALSDPLATRHASRLARSMNRHLFIVVRTRSVSEIDELYQAGANMVIPEEFETSIEIFISVLREYHIPNNVVEAQVALLRQERYSLLRGLRLPQSVVDQLGTILAEGATEAVVLLQHSPVVGKTLLEAGLLEGCECSLVAIVRGGHAIVDFNHEEQLRAGDTLVITGIHANIDRLMERLVPARA